MVIRKVSARVVYTANDIFFLSPTPKMAHFIYPEGCPFPLHDGGKVSD